MKAIIPVAGLGTRMLPASKAISQRNANAGRQTLIQYVVEETCGSGH